MKESSRLLTDVLRISNPFFVQEKSFLAPTEITSDQALNFALSNKILPLLCKGCHRMGIDFPEKWHEIESELRLRKKAQVQALGMLVDECMVEDIDFICFKTLRPIEYVPDDVDILLRSPHDKERLMAVMRQDGYGLLARGTPEVTVRKTTGDTYVQIDVHTRLAVGHFLLLETASVWEHLRYLEVEGFSIPVLSEEMELVLEGAYSLMKDFHLTPPALYRAVWSSRNLDCRKAVGLAQHVGLVVPLRFFLQVSEFFSTEVLRYGQLGFAECLGHEKNENVLLEKILDIELRRERALPYSYPPLLVACAYLAKSIADLRLYGTTRRFAEIAMQPSAKGIKIFLDYLRALSKVC